MHHKEHNTLDLLEQFTHNTQISSHKADTNETMLFKELGQLMSKSDKKSSNSLFGIPNFIWYLIMLGMVGYLIKEIFFLNEINDVSTAVSTINQSVTKEITEIQNSAHKALENANAKKEGR
ncbi:MULTISPECIES: hypothetical protein [unclassified Sulfurospirillum]|uniref:hypothetical protein n=1 Tax=unclassified Sulfurospirillum TaxID=2618290 RepID=UPI000502C308|nr:MULTISPECIES: hypothetical protein [unclassified Sulfurospirillum]KFL34519.1 hypothetical protein JU57_05785 [Sulfurospirillum sp. SCADC]